MLLKFPISEHILKPFNDENKQQQNTMMHARRVLCLILVFFLSGYIPIKILVSLSLALSLLIFDMLTSECNFDVFYFWSFEISRNILRNQKTLSV